MAVALAVHEIAGSLLAGRDVILSFLVGDRSFVVMAVLVLLAARLFLFLLAPGWVLHALVTLWLERRLRARSPSPR
jgi:hypothetical protein